MKAEKYSQLSEVHLLQRIWRNELELAAQEVKFWEDLLGTLGEGLDPGVTDADTWQTETNQLHHFQRLTKRLPVEMIGFPVCEGDGAHLIG